MLIASISFLISPGRDVRKRLPGHLRGISAASSSQRGDLLTVIAIKAVTATADKSEHILAVPIAPIARTPVNAQRSRLRVQRGVIAPATREGLNFSATSPRRFARSIDDRGGVYDASAILSFSMCRFWTWLMRPARIFTSNSFSIYLSGRDNLTREERWKEELARLPYGCRDGEK